MTKGNSESWLKSREATKELKVSDCDLMHLREAGKLEYKKDKNAFLYSKTSIERLKLSK